MKWIQNSEGSLKAGLSLFCVLGSTAGSIFCNRMSLDMKQELSAVGGQATKAVLDQVVTRDLFLQIWTKRIWGLTLLLLILSVRMTPMLLVSAAAYFGFSLAVLTCPLTMNAGALGLWNLFLSLFPQCLVYVPVGYLLFWWLPMKHRRLSAAGIFTLICAVTVGAFLESFLNPWFSVWIAR